MENTGRVRFYIGSSTDIDDSNESLTYTQKEKNKLNTHFYLSILSIGISVTALIFSILTFNNYAI